MSMDEPFLIEAVMSDRRRVTACRTIILGAIVLAGIAACSGDTPTAPTSSSAVDPHIALADQTPASDTGNMFFHLGAIETVVGVPQDSGPPTPDSISLLKLASSNTKYELRDQLIGMAFSNSFLTLAAMKEYTGFTYQDMLQRIVRRIDGAVATGQVSAAAAKALKDSIAALNALAPVAIAEWTQLSSVTLPNLASANGKVSGKCNAAYLRVQYMPFNVDSANKLIGQANDLAASTKLESQIDGANAAIKQGRADADHLQRLSSLITTWGLALDPVPPVIGPPGSPPPSPPPAGPPPM